MKKKMMFKFAELELMIKTSTKYKTLYIQTILLKKNHGDINL